MVKVRPELSSGIDMSNVETNQVSLDDGITAPAAVSGRAIIYVDVDDGDLKIIFANGFVATIAADS